MSTIRIGHGYDLHRLQDGGRLVLGSVTVAENLSPIAHSDGDVVLHALVDAIMGALALGDIGQRFSNRDPRWKGVASRVFLEEVWREAQAGGWRLGNVDVTILAERPRLAAFKPAIRTALAQMLSAGEDQVNIKAGTNEECDAIGRGEAIAAHAVILLVRGA